ncbi:alpha/beta fold hydrolase [Kordiimonas aestuarii]|uniref:alpha/beta fold hydrolase n=1 Tax=Kordiimonas aestuarii TaxID=1005925 RepID=UPI0021D0CBD1|nr:alpha/beta fold hydrolase [Kordiimonas aestuarii]
MELSVRERGEGEPLLMLHGLFGSADNLGGITRKLETDFRVISPDLRNHGRSPHVDGMSYPEMAADVIEMLDRLDIASCHIFGHSMGGKAAMQLTLHAPERVKRLVVGDIAPVAYGNHHSAILKGLRAVAESDAVSRADAEAILADYEDEPDVLSFLLTNWRRGADGKNRWRIELDAIEKGYADIVGNIEGNAVETSVLFLRGGLSDYIKPEYRDNILARFPHAMVRTVEGTGHWLHAEKPDLVARLIKRFLLNKL